MTTSTTFAAMLSNEKFAAIPWGLASAVGWAEAAMLVHLASLTDYFAELVGADEEGRVWIYRSDEEIAAQLSVDECTVRRMRKRLVGHGLVMTSKRKPKVGGTVARMHYAVDLEAMAERCRQPGKVHGSNRAKCPDTSGQSAQKGGGTPLLSKKTYEKRSHVDEGKTPSPSPAPKTKTHEQTEQLELSPDSQDEQARWRAQVDESDTFDVLALLDTRENASAIVGHLRRWDDFSGKKLKIAPHGVTFPLLRLWSLLWGKDTKRTKFSAPRRKAWVAMVNEGWKPSDLAKAMIGMTHDDWPDRVKHCDWHLVVRQMDHWLELYDEKGPNPAPLFNSKNAKIVNGVVVPIDYRWTIEDDHGLAAGMTFNFDKRTWGRK